MPDGKGEGGDYNCTGINNVALSKVVKYPSSNNGMGVLFPKVAWNLQHRSKPFRRNIPSVVKVHTKFV